MINISTLSPATRKFFLGVIRRFAVETKLSETWGLEGAEEEILHQIDEGRITVGWDKERGTVILEVL